MNDHALRLYFIPSPFGMNWATPSSLAKTAAVNKFSFRPRFMGHVNVEIRHGGRVELTGMVAKKLDAVSRVIFDQQGFGILYHSFAGRMENAQELRPELEKYAHEGRLSFIEWKLNEEVTSRLLTYLDEYRQDNVGSYYGLHNRPLHGEGGGCSAFGASFVEVAGLMNDEFHTQWSNQVLIPLEFSGAPLSDKKVNILNLILKAHRWARPDEAHVHMHYWDPDRMHAWVINQSKNASEHVQTWHKSLGLVFDERSHLAPSFPIWKERRPADYDGRPRR